MNRRLGFTDQLVAFVQAHEGQWLDAIRFEQFGRQAWRTRISEARLRLKASGQGTIQNRVLQKDGMKRSQYRFLGARPQTLLDMLERSA